MISRLLSLHDSHLNIFFPDMSNGRDTFKLSRDWLSVQEVVDAVGSASCGAISVFIGLCCVYQSERLSITM